MDEITFEVLVEKNYKLKPGDVIYNYDGERIGSVKIKNK